MATLHGNKLYSETSSRRAQSVVIPSSRQSYASKVGEAVVSSKPSSKAVSQIPPLHPQSAINQQQRPPLPSHPSSKRSEVSRHSMPVSHNSGRSVGAERGTFERGSPLQTQHLEHLSGQSRRVEGGGSKASQASRASEMKRSGRSVRTGGF